MLSNEMMIASGGTPPPSPDVYIGNSVRFNSVDSAYLNRTPSVAGNRQKWTFSCWIKRTAFSTGTAQTIIAQSPTSTSITYGASSDTITVQISSGSSYWVLVTNAVYRDPAAWTHIVLAVDTTKALASDRVRLYADGAEVTSFSTNQRSSIAQNTNTEMCNTTEVDISRHVGAAGLFFNGYLADIYLIDGQQLTPTSFGKISSINSNWVPTTYSGSYGTTGFHLPFTSGSTPSALGTDTSGNSNTWTVNNISVTAGAGNDWLTDAPSNNYCTWNPLKTTAGNSYANGNLDNVNSNYTHATEGSIAVSSGKWYFEWTRTGGSDNTNVGVRRANIAQGNDWALDTNFWVYFMQSGGKGNGQAYPGTAYGATYTTNDIIGVAFDLDNGALYFSKNGVWQNSGDPTSGASKTGAAFTNLSGDITAFTGETSTGGSNSTVNFGQRAFAYTPPTGFKSLCQSNLPTPLTTQPYLYHNSVLYTGSGSPLSIINLHLQPDLVWIKSRSAATNNTLYDSTRGSQARLESNATNAETTSDSGLLSFAADGFSLGTLAQVNTNASTYVAWTWKKGATPGFDVVTYTGNGANRTIAHSLGVAPEFMIVKARSIASTWYVWHSSLTSAGYAIALNSTAAQSADATAWNSTAPSSTVFSLGTNTATNGNGTTYVAYLFANKEGYCKLGKSIGNGSSDGPFVYCGFKPRFILFKRADSVSDWTLFDSARSTYNPATAISKPAKSDAESSAASIDLLANGFKCRSTDTDQNGSGGTYVFAAFAESPFKYPRTQFSSSQSGLNLKGLRFNSADSSFLSRTPSVSGDRKTFSISFWMKFTGIGRTDQEILGCSDSTWDSLMLAYSAGGQVDQLLAQTPSGQNASTAKYRDPSQWYHVLYVRDTTQATQANREKFYVNGTQITTSGSLLTLNQTLNINNNVAHYIGKGYSAGSSNGFNGYLADYYFIDGQAKSPTDFAMTNTTTGQWVPIIYSGTYGTNGCHLTFADSSSTTALGYDTSGNSNNWTVSNLSVTNDRTQDCLSDSPTVNYCTLNPIAKNSSTIMLNGALDFTPNGSGWIYGGSTFGVSSGKWYWELYVHSKGDGVHTGILASSYTGGFADLYANALAVMYNSNDGNKYVGGSSIAYGATYTTGDTVGIALDMDSGKIWFSKNGTWQASGDPVAGTNYAANGLTGLYSPVAGAANNVVGTSSYNFGQRPFSFIPPTGFKTLCSTNLPSPAILKPNQYFDVSLYTGTGA